MPSSNLQKPLICVYSILTHQMGSLREGSLKGGGGGEGREGAGCSTSLNIVTTSRGEGVTSELSSLYTGPSRRTPEERRSSRGREGGRVGGREGG